MVFIENLERGMIVAQDVYDPENPYIPLVKKNTFLTAYMVYELRDRGIRFVYVRDEPAPYKPRAVYIPKAEPVIDAKLRDNALKSLEEAFSLDWEDVHESSATVVQRIDEVVEQIVDALLEEKHALVNINDLKSYDDYTFHHSLSVAVLSVAVGQHMGFDRQFLKRIGTGSIMHDIGKTSIPIELIHKRSRLDDNEYSILKTHAVAGYVCLTKTHIRDEDMLQGVLHHHERFDGTGYPDHLKAGGIPLLSRIITVADVYDALTSIRPYRSPMQPSDAVEYIMGGAGTIFDYDMVSAFMQKVELYSVGSFVELSNGEAAVVLNNKNQLRPVVRVVSTDEVLDLYRDRHCLNIVIKRVLPDISQWNVN